MTNPMSISRFSAFNDGMDVAKSKPKPLGAHTITANFAAASGAVKSRRSATAKSRLDDAYTKGYKTALLDTLYAADMRQQEQAAMQQPMQPMGVNMDMMDGMPPQADPYAQPMPMGGPTMQPGQPSAQQMMFGG